MIRTDRRLRICAALLVCNLVFIWGNSLLPGEVSGALSSQVGQILEAVFGPSGPDKGHESFLLRKMAHFLEFAALGSLLGWLFAMTGKRKTWPIICGVMAACIDETIQMFVPGRGPGIRDVLIDSCGVITGMILLHLGHTCYRNYFVDQLEEN